MKEKKRRFEIFSFYDHTGVERHMEKMAEKGWLVEKISGLGWVYRRIQPKKLKFAVSFYPKTSPYDPELPEGMKTYQEMCSCTGWVLAASSGQMQIFYNEQPDPVPIETDPVTEVETIHRAAKRTYLRSYWVMLVCGVLELMLSLSSFFREPVEFLAKTTSLFALTDWTILFIMCLWELIAYYRWRRRARKAAEAGVFLETRGTSGMQKTFLAVVILGFGCWIGSILAGAPPLLRYSTLGSLLWVTLLILAVNGLRVWMRKKKVSEKVNFWATTVASFLLSFLLLGGVMWGVIQAEQHGLFAGDRETYEHWGRTYTVYEDDLPLTLEDLLGGSFGGYTRERKDEETVLMGLHTMKHQPRYDMENRWEKPELEYVITRVKVPALYDFAKDSIIASRRDEVYAGGVLADHFEPVDPGPWGAEEAYRWYWDDGYMNEYVLCYHGSIVHIDFDWEPTPEQMAVVGEKLGK